MEKYSRAGKVTDDNMAQAQCMLDTKAYKHTLTIRNIICYATAAMVARTPLQITSCVSLHFLSCCTMSQPYESSQHHTNGISSTNPESNYMNNQQNTILLNHLPPQL